MYIYICICIFICIYILGYRYMLSKAIALRVFIRSQFYLRRIKLIFDEIISLLILSAVVPLQKRPTSNEINGISGPNQ